MLLMVCGFGPSAYVISKGWLVSLAFMGCYGNGYGAASAASAASGAGYTATAYASITASSLNPAALIVLGILFGYSLLVCSLLVRWTAERSATRVRVTVLETCLIVIGLALLPVLLGADSFTTSIPMTLGWASRTVELTATLLDQTVVLYGAFVCGLSLAVCHVLWFWCRRLGFCYSWSFHSVLEMLWTVVPVAFLMLGLVHGLATLYAVAADTAVHGCGAIASVVGHQWYWELDGTDSRLCGSASLPYGCVRLTLVDQPLFVAAGSSVAISVSSVDVIHCYSVPALGIKVDAIPGRVSLVTVSPLIPGYFSGYCAELCGSGHGFMPCGVLVYSNPAHGSLLPAPTITHEPTNPTKRSVALRSEAKLSVALQLPCISWPTACWCYCLPWCWPV